MTTSTRTRTRKAAARKSVQPPARRGTTVYTVEYAPFGGQTIDPSTGMIEMAPDPQWELAGIFASKRSAEAYCTTRAETDEAFRRGRWTSQVTIQKREIK